MKSRVQIALVCSLLSVVAHLYLALHFYPLKAGILDSRSLCYINSKWDCHAVSASNYSEVFGIPLAVWGAVVNCVLFVLILMAWLEWTEQPERMRRWALLLAGLSMGASIIMGSISTFLMSTYCIFCISLYFLSVILFFAYRDVLREGFWSHISDDISHLWTDSRGVGIAYLSIPLLAFFFHQIFMENLGVAQVNRLVGETIQEWQQSPKYNFVAKPTLARGPSAESAALTLVEFADFRCGHCKHASYSLHAFVGANPDVRFEFYTFPLDGACNAKMESSNGISCRLAEAVYCAEKSSKGWDLHDWLYENQDQINTMSTVGEIDVLLGNEIANMGLSWESVKVCIDDSETHDAIRAQAKQGDLVNVQGTPTLFANGRLLNRLLLPALQEARRQAIVEKSH